MTHELLEQLLRESESPYLDFKQAQYPFVGASDEQKSELLKDILAFANAFRRTDAYILIGVAEVKGERAVVHGISSHFDDATLQQFVNSKTQRAIDFSVETVALESRKIDIIKIPAQQRPFYLKKHFGKLRASTVYFRRGTSCSEANPEEIATMGVDRERGSSGHPKLEINFSKCAVTSWWHGTSREESGTIVRFDARPLDTSLVEGVLPIGNSMRFDDRQNETLMKQIEWSHKTTGMFHPVTFAIKNVGQASALNVEAHVIVMKDKGLFLTTEAAVNPFSRNSLSELLADSKKVIANGIALETKKDCWKIRLRAERILPGHVIFPPDSYVVAAKSSGRWELKATMYADNLPEPNQNALWAEIDVTEK
ncbi:MAG: hypothetical protein JWM68_1885 [Verrucomicrobiales bacterium]|nr:hypothetical protein [Verrucomicrobiales bacterium]